MDHDEKRKKDLEPVSMAVIETSDPAATAPVGTAPVGSADGTAATVAGPPRDGQGCEGVTVVIVFNDADRANITAASVRQNLIGADADVRLVRQQDTLVETLLHCLEEATAERIVLMNDAMFILNPVTLYDIGVLKKPADRMPALFHRSALLEVLTYLKANYPYADIATSYRDLTPLRDVRPLEEGDWRTSPWLLPVVSRSPDIRALSKFAEWKKFLYVSPQSWTDALTVHLKKRFPV